MHPVIFDEFNRICSLKKVDGKVLEIGATPSKTTLLNLPAFKHAAERVGVNLNKPSEFQGFKIRQENSNSMSFDDNTFDLVVSNATLEHDKYFWKTLNEIRRVTKPGGMIVIGVPGYRFYRFEKIKYRLRQSKWLRKLYMHPTFNLFFFATITFEVHDYPGDYFRFSEQAVKDVLLDGCDEVAIKSLMLPPRIIGWGLMPEKTG